MPAPKRKSKYNPEAARAKRLATLFNITPDEYEVMLAFQRGVCAVCQRPPKVGGNRLSVDHNHKTGLVRGLVCWQCNKAIARIGDNADFAEAMARYLRWPPATGALGREVLGRPGRTTNKQRTRKKK